MKILLPVDGSEYARRAANYVAEHASQLKESPEIHVLHVHPKLPYSGAAKVVGKAAIKEYQREESEAALKVCQKELKSLKLDAQAVWIVGDVVEEVERYVKKHDIDLIVIGSRGRGAVSTFALGSVTTKLLAALKTPILVIR
jgi:nucleotide-binding universal stress UspA family protein